MGFIKEIVLFSFILLFFECHGYPTGAPQSACSTLTPVHRDNYPQRSRPPYTVTVDQIGNRVRVTISSPTGEQFQGFMLQARSNRDRERMIDGTFTTQSGISKTIDCPNGKQNTLTQVNKNTKYEVVTEWTPAPGVHEDVIFRATVAETFQRFWTQIDSVPVRIDSSSEGSTQRQKEDFDSRTMYDKCFSSKGCFGYPANCVSDKNCDVLLTYMFEDNGVSFNMMGSIRPGTYMAMALSNDSIMGDDSVTECFEENGQILVQNSWNDGKSNKPLSLVPEGMYEGRYEDGMVSCSWKRPNLTFVQGRMFDLVNSSFHILMAIGPVEQGRIRYHDNRLASQNAVKFSAYKAIEGETAHDAVKVHGAFMVTAWVALVSLAILLARHFKAAWENHTLFGVKIWFAFHRGLMIVALVFVVIAFIIIFVHKDGWNYNTRNPHAILGCIATALGLFQPIMALFRPSPDHPKRPIFNWLHWAVGNCAQIIAVVTIFFAVTLESSGLKKSFYWVMGVFVVIHCFFHIVFQLHTWNLEKKKNNEIKMLEMSAGRTSNMARDSHSKNRSGDVFRILVLGIYGIFLTVIMLALYALIGVA